MNPENRPLFSVIVPVYKVEKYIHQCVDSILAQSFSDFELILVDDGSPDNCGAICEEYAAKDPRVKVVHKENGGLSDARNVGLEMATGEYVLFVDSDDWVAPDMYEKMVRRAEETGADVVGCDYHMTTEQSMKIGRIMPNNTREQTGLMSIEKGKLWVMNPGSMVIKIYLKAVIDENHLRFPEKTYYEDNCASPIWMLHFTHFEKVEEPLYYYYQHEESTVHAISMEKCEARLLMGKRLIEDARKYGFYKMYRKEFEFAFTKLYYMNTLYTYMLGVKRPKLAFLKLIAKGMIEEFPDFQDNVYYLQEYDEEQKKMAALHIKSPLAFLIYFKLLYAYRKLAGKL